MKALTPVAIDNQIKLVSDYSRVTLKLLVPSGNIQRMKTATGCCIISKTTTKVNFSHNAGQLYTVEISVMWAKISPFLTKTTQPTGFENSDEYAKMIGEKLHDLHYAYNQILDANKIALYAFGQPILRRNTRPTNGIYKNKIGRKISLLNRFENHVNFKREWFYLVDTK